MDKWEIAVVVFGIITFGITVGVPIAKLISTITSLNSNITNLNVDLRELTTRNSESHRRLWEHNEEQDKRLGLHDQDISVLKTQVGVRHD